MLAAIEQGDVGNLMGILRAEHAKRSGPAARRTRRRGRPAPRGRLLDCRRLRPRPPPEGPAGIDAAIIDELIRISADNDVTVDWLMLRAVKLYVEEYRKTGQALATAPAETAHRSSSSSDASSSMMSVILICFSYPCMASLTFA